jgi:hypothetical protein
MHSLLCLWLVAAFAPKALAASPMLLLSVDSTHSLHA